MTIRRKVDAAPLCRRELALFGSVHEAWAHLVKHVLDAREAWGWAVLIPALRGPLNADRRPDLHEQARKATPDAVPPDLADVWTSFLDLVAIAVEQGVWLEWFWEEKAALTRDGPYKVFAADGILTYLDDEVVRTGFLPSKEDLPPVRSERVSRYELFSRCWKKVRHMYQRAAQERRLVNAPSALHALMHKMPDLAAWERLK